MEIMLTMLTIFLWLSVALVWAVPAFLLWAAWDDAGRSWRNLIRQWNPAVSGDVPPLEVILAIALAAWWSVAAPTLMAATFGG